MQVKSIAESSTGSILQYFRPSLSYHLSLRPLFCLFLSLPFYTGFTVPHKLYLLQLVEVQHEISVLITYTQKPYLNCHADLSNFVNYGQKHKVWVVLFLIRRRVTLGDQIE